LPVFSFYSSKMFLEIFVWMLACRSGPFFHLNASLRTFSGPTFLSGKFPPFRRTEIGCPSPPPQLGTTFFSYPLGVLPFPPTLISPPVTLFSHMQKEKSRLHAIIDLPPLIDICASSFAEDNLKHRPPARWLGQWAAFMGEGRTSFPLR